MTLVRPSGVITLDGERLTTAEGAVVGVRVRLGMGPAHDEAQCFCWPSSQLKKAKPGASLSIALGDAGGETDVWTGEVTSVRLTPDAVTLVGLANSVALSRTFVSQTFADVSVADLVRQLASAAGVDVDDIAGNTTLAAYAVDDRRSAWSHIQDLARLVGADITVTPAGALKFAAPAAPGGGGVGGGLLEAAGALVFGGGSGGLRYGANVMEWRASSGAQPATASVAAYGSGSESGSDKWHWIRSEPTGSGSGPMLVVPALSTRDGASTMADALAARATGAKRRATVIVGGDATLRPGQTTTIADIPGGVGGDLRILAVEHALMSDSGLLTSLTVEPAT